MAQPLSKAYEQIAATQPRGTYRGAVVGCGRMGSTIDDEHIGMPHYPWPWAHAPAIIEARGIELIGAADVDRAKLDDFAQRWGVDALYEDYRELVAQEQPDVVAVTTRPDERAEVVIGLAEAGVRAIFATKPMCRTLAEADAMIAACEASGTIFFHRLPSQLVQLVHQCAAGHSRRSDWPVALHGLSQPAQPVESAKPYAGLVSAVLPGHRQSG